MSQLLSSVVVALITQKMRKRMHMAMSLKKKQNFIYKNIWKARFDLSVCWPLMCMIEYYAPLKNKQSRTACI